MTSSRRKPGSSVFGGSPRRAGKAWVLAFALLAACAGSAGPEKIAPVIAIVGATVVYPENDGATASAANQTLVVSGHRIEAVGPADKIAVPDGATVIDGHGKWVIPGLVDSHVHFFQSGNLYTRPDAADFNKVVPYAQETARNKARLPATFKLWLASGVTSVIDVGGPFWNFDVREAAAQSPAAPRVEVAGPLISMIDDPPLDLGDPPIMKVTSPDEARALVARELARSPDFIKVWYIHRKTDDLAKQEAIVKAAADAAHAAGVRLAVHATELETAKSAMRAGADLLVHSVFDAPIDDEFIALAKKRHVLYCPTLFVWTSYELAFSGLWQPTEAERRLADPEILAGLDISKIPHDQLPKGVAGLLDKHEAPKPPTIAMQNLKKLWDAGITIVLGTDAGNIGTVHGPSVFREMELMVQSGLTPLQVLRSATTNAALALGREKDLGAVVPGKLADLVLLDADPLTDVEHMSHASRVLKDGALFDPARLMQSIR